MEVCSSKQVGVQVFKSFSLIAIFCHWETEAQSDLAVVTTGRRLLVTGPLYSLFSLTSPIQGCGGQIYPICIIEKEIH